MPGGRPRGRRGADAVLAVAARGQKGLRSKGLLTVIFIVSAASLLGMAAHFSVMRPLKELEENVKEIARGKLDRKIDTKRRDEIGSLAQAFNDMTVNLKKSYADLRHRYSQLTNLYKISKAVSAEHDIDALLHLVLRQSLDLMGADTGSLMLIAPSGGGLTIRGAEGSDPGKT